LPPKYLLGSGLMRVKSSGHFVILLSKHHEGIIYAEQ